MVYELKNNFLSVKINSFGAELCSVISNETATEYIWQADKVIWNRHAPNLFPIVGKLKDGCYTYQNKSYQLPQHGFARDNEFICIENSDSVVIFELTANEKSLRVFPFHFSLQIKYTLVENNLKVNYSVLNPDNSVLYFSIGAHPAFNCPLSDDESFEDYELIFPNKKSLTVNELNDGLITKQTKTLDLHHHKLPVSQQLFENDALVFTNHQIDEVQLVSKKTKKGVALKSLNWPYFGIWTKKQTSQFICLEPWYGIADSEHSIGNFITKTGIIQLESEQNFDVEFEMTFI
jgi:galactose mutarotase-like enzyme